jgi:hypothetical protein
MTIAHSKMGKMTVCYNILMLYALSSRSMLSVLVGVLVKKFGLFLNTPRLLVFHKIPYLPKYTATFFFLKMGMT